MRLVGAYYFVEEVKRGGIGRVPFVRYGDILLCGQCRHKGAGLRMTVRIEGGEFTPRG